MFLKLKFALVLYLAQLWLPSSEGNHQSIEDVVLSYSEIISKMRNELSNLSSNAYSKSSEKVNMVLQNNSLEFAITKEYLSQMHTEMNKVLIESELQHFPQLTKDCRDNYESSSELLGKTIAETENICLIFIANVFSLIENPILYDNITDTKILITDMEQKCSNKSYVTEAEGCFRVDIISHVRPIIRELSNDVKQYLQLVEEKANSLTTVLHTCYDTVRKDVLIRKLRKGIRNFRQCLASKSSKS